METTMKMKDLAMQVEAVRRLLNEYIQDDESKSLDEEERDTLCDISEDLWSVELLFGELLGKDVLDEITGNESLKSRQMA